jgi:dTDP-4-dehydrorhamnose reductase
MLGMALSKEMARRGVEHLGIARKNAGISLDVSNDTELLKFFTKEHFDVIVNTVAIIDLAVCDANPGLAYTVNARPISVIANCSPNSYFVHISTDGYFSGDGSKKHDENDQVVLLNEYARTKFAAEAFCLAFPKVLVVRTNIVGFRNDKRETFVEWIINSIKNEDNMTLFNDYFVSSISVLLFSKILMDLIEKKIYGLINVGSREVFSKAEFIKTLADVFGFNVKNATVGSVKKLFPNRGESLGLDVSRAETILGYTLPTLNDVIFSLNEEYHALQE